MFDHDCISSKRVFARLVVIAFFGKLLFLSIVKRIGLVEFLAAVLVGLGGKQILELLVILLKLELFVGLLAPVFLLKMKYKLVFDNQES